MGFLVPFEVRYRYGIGGGYSQRYLLFIDFMIFCPAFSMGWGGGAEDLGSKNIILATIAATSDNVLEHNEPS